MRHIIKQKSPDEFEAWKDAPKTEDSDEKPSDFDNEFQSNPPEVMEEGIVYYSKEELKAELLKEQNGLCCYCNKSMEEEKNSPIEHLKPKGKPKYKHLTFEYKNLLASCNGNQKDNDGKKKEPKPRILHCDAEKKDNEIELTPLMPECETEIIYAENGSISGITERAKQTIKVLNLDCNILTDIRKGVIQGKLFKEIIPKNSSFDYNDLTSNERISKQKAEELYNELSKTKSEPYVIAILQVLKQNF